MALQNHLHTCTVKPVNNGQQKAIHLAFFTGDLYLEGNLFF